MANRDEFEYKFEILMNEKDNLHENIRSFEGILFRIKGWAITVYSGTSYVALREDEPDFLILSVGSTLLFWHLEATYKRFQRTFIVRVNKIEHFLRTKKFSQAVETRSFSSLRIPDFQGRHSVKDLDRKTSVLRVAFFWHTFVLYLTMLVFACGLYAWMVWLE